MHFDDACYQAKYVSVIWQKLIPSQADFNVQPSPVVVDILQLARPE
ncbi:3'-5' exoribonuclease [Escherichia coli]|nr:3'-5' exoribonuclease [Escherichia coli]